MAQTNVQVFSGNVGIGTTSPGGLLDIRAVASDPSVPTVHIGDNTADFGDYGMVNLVRNPTESGTKAHLAFVRSGNTIFSQGYYNDTNTFGFWPSFASVTNTPAMAFATNGNVGIGTATPGGQLEVHGVGQTTTTSFNQSGNLGGILTVKSSNGSAGDGGGIMFGANQGYFAAIKGTLSDGGDYTSGELRFCTRNPPSSSTMQVNMVINRAGYVGIGTTEPSQGNLTVQGLGADPYFFGQSSGTYADATDFTGLGHFKSTGSHGVIRVSNSSDTSGSTRIDFNTRLGGYWGTNSVLSSFFRGTAPAAGRIMVSGETADYYEDANMTFWTCRDGYDTGGRFDNLGGTGSLRERMRITSNGNVGIGTNNPGAKLEVHGADLTGQPTGTTCIISRHVAGLDGVLNIFGVAAANGEETLGLQTQIDGREWATDINAGWNYGSDTRYDLCLQPYKGKVGIGITDPSSALHVQGSSTNHNGAPDGASDSGLILIRNTKTGNTPYSMALGVDQTHGFGYLNAAGNSQVQPICINTRGANVGIGVTNPESKLEVRGHVQASTSESDNGVYVRSYGSIHRDFGNSGAGFHITSNAFFPTNYQGDYVNGGVTWGSAAYRWGQIFSTSTSISNSDRNLKQDINDITESEKNVATKITDLFKTFRFKDAVSKKGDDARLHNGIIAQDLIEAFESEGLDAHRYGLFCYDEKWTVDGEHELMETIYEKDGISEYTNEDGEVVKYTVNDEGVEAVKRRLDLFADKDTPGAVFDSSIYSIRYEELLCFVVSALAKNEDLQAEKAKVATLETQVADLLARVQTLEGA